ncbi:MAG: thiamine-phosphate kinase [Pseudomonadota bacterium]
MDEDGLIETYFAPLATAEGAARLGDDAATFSAGGGEVVATCDALAAGVHFFPDDPPAAIAAKALRVNLSDIAAKGAEPFGYLLALALADGTSHDWVKDFASGLAADQARYGVELLGGDTLRASPGGGTTIAITAFGRVPNGAIVRRGSALPGDHLVVTGTIGDAALGLVSRLNNNPFSLSAAAEEALTERYLFPNPPVGAWRAVRDYANAAMDISDGLVGDALKLSKASGVSAVIDAETVPHSPEVLRAVDALAEARDLALTGGDDYQILACIAPDRVAAFTAACADAGVSAFRIGRLGEGPPAVKVRFKGADVTLRDGRFQHF